jgi:hypothetical protein
MLRTYPVQNLINFRQIRERVEEGEMISFHHFIIVAADTNTKAHQLRNVIIVVITQSQRNYLKLVCSM